MKRLLSVLLLAASTAMLTAGPTPAGVNSRAEVVPEPPAGVVPPAFVSGRDNIEFNTGGEMFTPATTAGSASGWAFAILHIYVYSDPVNSPMQIVEFGYPTNSFAADPIPLPVDWYLEITADELPALPYPWYFNWDHQGTFYPAGEPETNPPDTYTVLDVQALDIFFQDGDLLYWGYENAGLCGQVSFSGVETWGYYTGSGWESDAPYGRTSLMQFRAVMPTTPAQERSLSAIKSLY